MGPDFLEGKLSPVKIDVKAKMRKAGSEFVKRSSLRKGLNIAPEDKAALGATKKSVDSSD